MAGKSQPGQLAQNLIWWAPAFCPGEGSQRPGRVWWVCSHEGCQWTHPGQSPCCLVSRAWRQSGTRVITSPTPLTDYMGRCRPEPSWAPCTGRQPIHGLGGGVLWVGGTSRPTIAPQVGDPLHTLGGARRFVPKFGPWTPRVGCSVFDETTSIRELSVQIWFSHSRAWGTW